MLPRVKSLIIASCSALCLLVGLLWVANIHVLPTHSSALSNPVVVAVNPPINYYMAPITSGVSVQYDQAIDPDTVTSRTFVVHAGQTGVITEVYGTENDTLFLTPTTPFKPGELIEVSVTTNTANLAGEHPISSTVWQFKTAVTGSGRGYYVDSGQRLGNSYNPDIGLGDLDNDGDLDAFVTDWGAPAKVWFNDGSGTFSDSGQLLSPGHDHALGLGDLDGDGDLDAFVADHSGSNEVWVNDGSGFFTNSGQEMPGESAHDLALGDLDGDGDIDAFIVNHIDPSRVWLNNGAGYFTQTTQGIGPGGLERPRYTTLGDVDGDGDLDAIIAADYTPPKLWLNDGTAYFIESSQLLGSSGALGLALGDLDNDGDLDLYIGYGFGTTSPDKVWLNEGDGTFVDSGQLIGNSLSAQLRLGDVDSDGDLDVVTAGMPRVHYNDGTGFFLVEEFVLGDENVTDIALGDLDGDADLDVFLGYGYSEPDQIWSNHMVSDLLLEKRQTVAGSLITYTLIYTNNGPDMAPSLAITDILPTDIVDYSVFSSGPEITPTPGISYSWQVHNLGPGSSGIITVSGIISRLSTLINGASITLLGTNPVDNNLANNEDTVIYNELVVTNTYPAKNDALVSVSEWVSATMNQVIESATVHAGTFIVRGRLTGPYPGNYSTIGPMAVFTPTRPYLPGETLAASLLPGITARDNFATLIPYAWQFRAEVTPSTGLFVATTQSLGSANDIALGDLDQDGDLDAYVAKTGPDQVWFNNGRGEFVDSGQLLGNLAATAVALGDLDNDGDLDAFLTNASSNVQPSQVWINDGTGHFTDSGQSLGNGFSFDVALGDLDGDGDLDAFVGNNTWPGEPNTVWWNNGSAIFSDSGQRLGEGRTLGVTLGDLDGDGDLDAVEANDEPNNTNWSWLNDGTGQFFQGQPLGSRISFDAALGDLNSDGYLDLFSADRGGNSVWLNDGTGNMVNTNQTLGNRVTAGVELGDVDGDGDLDAYAANTNRFGYTRPDQVWLNNGAGTFTTNGQNLGNTSASSVALGDLDRDGDLDALVGNYEASTVWLNRNRADLAIGKEQQTQGQAITYTLTFTNLGPSLAVNTIVQDPLPANLSGINVNSNIPITPTGSPPFSWQVGNLPVGQGGIITITAVVSDFSFVENTASLTSDALDPVLSNNQATVQFNVADLALTKQQVINGQTITYTLTFTNQGPDLAYNIFLTDVIPTDLTEVTLASSGVVITATANTTFSWQVENMPLGSQGTITIVGTLSGQRTLVNTAVITSSLRDPVPANNSSQVIFNELIVNATLPAGNGRVFSPTQPITATFSRAISQTSVTSNTFRLYGQQSGLHIGDLETDNDTVWFTTSTVFQPGEVIVAGLSHDVRSVNGFDPLVPFTWQFRAPVHTGSGTLMSNQVIPDQAGLAASFGDVDNDGDLDILMANQPVWDAGCHCFLPTGANRLWLNSGSADFIDSGQLLGEEWVETRDIKLADFDNDGDLDALFVNSAWLTPGGSGWPTYSEIWSNDGSGQFQLFQSIGRYGDWDQTAAVGDVDGDNDVDIIMGTDGGNRNQVWHNDGSGMFTIGSDYLGTGWMSGISLTDMDNDGDLDAVTQSDVWLNDGLGDFTQTFQNLGGYLLSVGDINDDGLLDVVTANWEIVEVWFNTGSGNMVNSGQSLSNLGTGLALGDLDGDTDLDLYIARFPDWDDGCQCEVGGEDTVWLNQGGVQGGTLGLFVDSGQRLGNDRSQQIILGDLDGDGDLDAFVTNEEQTGRLWFNSHPEPITGLSLDSNSPTPLGVATAMSATVLSGNYVNFVWAFGDGSFGEGTSLSHLYPTTGTFQVVVTASNSLSLVTASMAVSVTPPIPITGLRATNDSPTEVSLFTHLTATVATGTNVTYNWDLGDGALGEGPFVDHMYTEAGYYTAVVTATNNNSTLVTTTPVTVGLFVVATDPLANLSVISRYGELTTTFSIPILETSVSTGTYSIWGKQTGIYTGVYRFDLANMQVIFDSHMPFKPGEEIVIMINRDIQSANGRLHAIPFIWQTRATVGDNDAPAPGDFILGTQIFDADPSTAVAIGDLDLDGDLDIIVGNSYSYRYDKVYLNDGNGVFIDSGQLLGTKNNGEIALGDLDGDNDLDAFMANVESVASGGRNEVWFNDGSGYFIDSGQLFGYSNNYGVALGDLDGDGDLDAYVANGGETTAQNRDTVWFNNGAGYFTDSGQRLGSRFSQDVELGDLDQDGDLDAFVVNMSIFGAPHEVWLNDGHGFFTSSGQNIGSSRGKAIALGDLDGDGDLDAFVVNSSTGGAPDTVWLNDGSGIFTTTGQGLGNHDGYGISLGDVDGDGDLDAFVANYEQRNKLWLNDGLATFYDSDILFTNRGSQGVVLGDIDGDRDLDAVVANYDYPGGQADEVWFNGLETIADLTAVNSSPTILGESTYFTAVVGSGTNVNFTWDFGDGATGTGPLVTHQFPQVGSYTAIVTATNSVNSLTATTMVTITSDVPISNLIVSNSSPTLFGEETVFSATVQGGTGVTFIWDYGDGLTGSGAFVSHTYADTGIYTATVTATNSANTLTATTIVTVTDIPIGGLIASNSSPTPFGEETVFSATVQGGTGVTFLWNYGDGHTGSGALVSHTYADTGIYTATVTATNSANTLTATTIVTVTDIPIGGLIASNSSPTPFGEETIFSATVQSGTGVNFIWNYGDGHTGSGAFVSHTYADTGIYTATVIAINSANTLTATTMVTITDITISGLIAVNDSPALPGDFVNFSATVSSGTHVSFVWAFGDGTQAEGATVSHAYTTTGIYTAVVTASNSLNSLQALTLITITETPDISISGLTITGNQTALLGQVTTLTASVGSGTNVFYTWDFGDGTTGYGEAVSHIYTQAGMYTAIVTATNSSSSAQAQLAVRVLAMTTNRMIFLPMVLRSD
ncbi:MAG: VCBS repeat-containing protein [Anaerolineae bacterium]|nr:VCBS repeat-containing protein [Anaerolineae bacterium]